MPVFHPDIICEKNTVTLFYMHVRTLFIKTWICFSRFPIILLYGCLSTVHGQILGVLVLMIGLNA